MEEEQAEEALRQYGMEDANITLIRHNENRTYCVEGTEGKYLLRVHKPKERFNTEWMDKGVDGGKIHKSELLFLEHLREQGLYVQTPVRNREGNLVTVLRDGTPATMLTWIEGRILNKDDLTEDGAYEIGRMIGRLHMAAEGYQECDTIRYDEKMCECMVEHFSSYAAEGRLKRDYYDTMANALHVIGERLRQSKKNHILVHSDLSLSNILLTEEGLVPIDFSLFGYSSPMIDFGSLYSFMGDEGRRRSAIEAYEVVRGVKVNKKEIEGYVALQVLLAIMLHFELWEKEEWFAKRLPEWCRNLFETLVMD